MNGTWVREKVFLTAIVGMVFCASLSIAGIILLAVQDKRVPPELGTTVAACLGCLAGILIKMPENGAKH